MDLFEKLGNAMNPINQLDEIIKETFPKTENIMSEYNKGALTRLQEENEYLSGLINGLKEENKALKVENSKLKTEAKSDQNEISYLMSELEGVETYIENAKIRLKSSETENECLGIEVRDLRALIVARNKRLNEIDSDRNPLPVKAWEAM